MRAGFHQEKRAAGALILAAVACLIVRTAAGQSRGDSASALIRFLTYQSDRADALAMEVGLAGCGHFPEDRAAARSLVGLGTAARTELDEALDSLEQSGKSSAFSPNAGWLLEAYAQVNGYQAYPRLRRMMENARLAFLQSDIDTSTAVALGLTSYVHAPRRPMRRFHCAWREEPSDALDQLVLGWIGADRPRVEENLGPQGQVALKQLLESEDRLAVRMGLSPDDRPGAAAVGYRFQQARGWVAPTSLIGVHAGNRNEVPAKGTNLEFHTVFTSASGKDCGAYTVRFAAEGTQDGAGRRYVVDNSDLAGLLRLITTCAMRKE